MSFGFALGYVTAAVAAAGYDAATTAWEAAVVAAGGTVTSTRKGHVDTLIVGLKTDGIWTKLDRLWVLAAENNQSARVDLVAASAATAVNSPTFTVDRGYAGNASTSYLNTNFNPSTNGVAFTLNSAHMAGWSLTNRAAGAIVITGGYDNSNVTDLMPWYGLGPVSRISSVGLNGNEYTANTSLGFFLMSRINSTTLRVSHNGAFINQTTESVGAKTNISMFICGRNDAGAFTSGMTDEVAAISYGGGLTDSEVTAFYNRLRTYMTAVDVP